MSSGGSTPLPRTSLGKYRIEALLGRGGMGEVYRAYDPSLDRTIALKTIRPEIGDAATLERFLREGRAAGRLRHPLIVTVYDLGEAEGVTFLSMEYLEGRSLSAVHAEGRLRFVEILWILIHVLDALDYAHTQGVVHRDVKPGNVQVLPDRSIKLLDFGVARLLTAESFSRTGTIVGTPYYMAPEQLRGEKVDGRADVYSVGALGYELLTHRRPFEGESLTEVILKVMEQPAAPMDSPWIREFPQVEAIIATAMAKRPEARYATAGAMAGELRTFLQREGAAIRAREDPNESEPRTIVAPLLAPPVTAHTDSVATVAPRLAPAKDTAPSSRKAAKAAIVVGVLVAIAAAVGAWWLRPRADIAVGGSGEGTRPTARPVAEGSGVPSAGAEGSTATAGIVFVEPLPQAGAASRDVAGALAEALHRRGLTVRESPAGAAWVFRVKASVSLRPSPFAGTSARTADYAGVLEAQDKTGGAARRFDFSGHAMEFGDDVVRGAALRELSEKMAARAARLAAPEPRVNGR